jgi:peptide/nickel transport system substrate-binding protein
LSACSAPDKEVESFANKVPDADKLNPSGSLILALSGEPTFFNPILYTDSESGSVVDLVFNGLVKVNKKLEVELDLADSMEYSPDGKSWKFYLKKGVKWHDGVEFTAEDVVFTFNTILSPKTNTVRRTDYIISIKKASRLKQHLLLHLLPV